MGSLGDRKKQTTKKFLYCIPTETYLGHRINPDDTWTCFEISVAEGNTLCDFLQRLRINEVDEKNALIETFGFHDAPLFIQCAILRLTGLTWKEIHECEEPKPSPKKLKKPKIRERTREADV
jgi:hypothetical protein